MSKFAIIKTGGKQYKVREKDVLKIEKISGETGDSVEFDYVMMVADGDKIEIGKPILENRKVLAKIIDKGKSKKVLVVKYKAKTRYKRRVGHRQMFTQVEILKI